MNRREFFKITGLGAIGFSIVPAAVASAASQDSVSIALPIDKILEALAPSKKMFFRSSLDHWHDALSYLYPQSSTMHMSELSHLDELAQIVERSHDVIEAQAKALQALPRQMIQELAHVDDVILPDGTSRKVFTFLQRAPAEMKYVPALEQYMNSPAGIRALSSMDELGYLSDPAYFKIQELRGIALMESQKSSYAQMLRVLQGRVATPFGEALHAELTSAFGDFSDIAATAGRISQNEVLQSLGATAQSLAQYVRFPTAQSLSAYLQKKTQLEKQGFSLSASDKQLVSEECRIANRPHLAKQFAASFDDLLLETEVKIRRAASDLWQPEGYARCGQDIQAMKASRRYLLHQKTHFLG